LEPKVETLSDGLWLAFTTAATVGYGDIVPSTHASRTFAVLVVLLGLAVFSLVTASVAAIFVGKEERGIERELMQEIRALRAEVAALHHHQQTLWTNRHNPKD
jgi:voltage-gated potassium channel